MTHKLGDFIKLQRGTTYKSNLKNLPGPVLLGLASIERNGGFRHDKLATYVGDSPDIIQVKSGDLFVSLKDVTQSADLLGAIARVPESIKVGRLTQDTVKIIFTKDVFSSEYIYWLLRTPQYRDYCRSHATGTTNLGLAREDFLSFQVPHITDTRLSIIDLLEALEKRIDLNRRVNETLEAMARALFKSWFVDFDPVKAKMEGRQPTGMDAETAALFPDRLVESELGMIPEGWRAGRLSDALTLSYGKALKQSDRIEGPFPVYGSGGRTGSHSKALVSGPGIIVGRKGTVGSIYWENNYFFPIDTTYYVEPHVGFPLVFLYELLHTLGLEKMNTDAAVPGLNRNNAYRLDIVIPDSEVASSFDKQLAPSTTKRGNNLSQIELLQKTRDALLPKLISGEISVAEAEKRLEADL